MKQLALHGGPKAKTVPYGKGLRFNGNELKYLQEALEQNTLFYSFGKQVQAACDAMRAYTGLEYVAACTSGSAAIHLGLIAAGIGPGDEVVCTPNTDNGTVLGIMEEGAVPIFCDCGYHLQPTPESIAAVLTPRTKAVVVVHLMGYPAPVDAIVALCTQHGIPVVEDCAQSWGTRLHGQLVGTFGIAGCYSTNDFKHLSTGDGGFVALSDQSLYRRITSYADKGYDRMFKGEESGWYHGINYRMSELQGAVARAQLERVDEITGRFNARGTQMRRLLKDLPGASMVPVINGAYTTCWKTVLITRPAELSAPRETLIEALQAEGITATTYAQYDLILKRLFTERIVRPWLEVPRSQYPFVQPDGREYHYSLDSTPVHGELLETALFIPLHGFHTEQDVEETAEGVWKVFSFFAKNPS